MHGFLFRDCVCGVWLSQLESQLPLASPEEYATMSDDLVMVHAAVQLGHKVRQEADGGLGTGCSGFGR